jgi:hypothetical protein
MFDHCRGVFERVGVLDVAILTVIVTLMHLSWQVDFIF